MPQPFTRPSSLQLVYAPTTGIMERMLVARRPHNAPASATPASRDELPSSGRLLRALAELICGLLTAATLSLGLQWVINRLPMPRPSALPSVVIMLGGTASLVVVVALLVARWRRGSIPLAWCALSAGITIPLSAVLNGTRYYLGGISVDQSFRTEYLTRLTDSPALADMAYQHVPPYYPGGWFWLGGRFANLFGQPGWAAYKPFAILTIAVVGVIVFTLWSLSVNRKTALALSAATVMLGMPAGAFEPYSWLVGATIPPLALLVWRLLRALSAGGRTGVATTATLGLILGVYGCLYTLYFFFAGLLLVALVTVVVIQRWARRHHDPIGPPAGRLLGRIAAHGALVAALAGAVLLLVWTPYLLGIVRGMRGHNVAARYLPPSGAEFPTPFLQFSVSGAICFLGLAWLVVSVRSGSRYPDVARALAATVATCYLWYLLSQLALLAHTTLLAFRIEPILIATLVCAAVMAIVEILGWGLPYLTQRWRWAARALLSLLAVATLTSPLQDMPSSLKSDLTKAFHDYYPTGRSASGTSHPADDGYWVPALNTAIRQLTGRPPDRNVVLGGDDLLLNTSPYWRFEATTPHYANPLAGYDARRTQVSTWARAAGSRALATELSRSRYPAPSVFVFYRAGNRLTLKLSRDVFPRYPNVQFYQVTFDRALFAGPQFHTRDVGPYTVVTMAAPHA